MFTYTTEAGLELTHKRDVDPLGLDDDQQVRFTCITRPGRNAPQIFFALRALSGYAEVNRPHLGKGEKRAARVMELSYYTGSVLESVAEVPVFRIRTGCQLGIGVRRSTLNLPESVNNALGNPIYPWSVYLGEATGITFPQLTDIVASKLSIEELLEKTDRYTA